MHEMSLIQDLIRKIETIARENRAERIAAVTIRLGALAHISAGHLREHFQQASLGTCAESARLEIKNSTDETAPDAQDILLDSVEVEV